MPTESSSRRIFALSRDVFFGMRIRTVVAQLGYQLHLSHDEAELLERSSSAALVLVDFNSPVSWGELADLLASDVPVIAFGAHTNVAGFRAAKAAGVTRVMSNGEFTRKLPGVLGQYLAR